MGNENILRDSLDALSSQDDEPVPWARRRALDSLLQSLNSAEILRLRCQINKIPTARDPCIVLPVDVLLRVADFLDLEDFTNATLVSHRWHETWRNEKISFLFIKRVFPLVFARYENLNETDRKDAGKGLCEWLPGAARHRIARVRGRYYSRWTVRWTGGQPYHIPRGHYVGDFQQYNSGRVARRRGGERIEVTCLFTGISSIYVDPDRERISYWILGDQFLVGCIGPGSGPTTRIRAWSLNSDYTDRVRLPSSFYPSASVHRDTVSFCKDSKFYIWRIGAALRSFEYPTSDSRPLEFPALFHPSNDDQFFVPHYRWNTPEASRTNRVLRLTVVEYIASIPREEYSFDVPMEDEPEQNSGILYTPARYSITDDGFCMFSWTHLRQGHAVSVGPRTCKYHLGQKPLGEGDFLEVNMVLTFDMYTKEFSLRHYFDVDNADSEPHIWRDQILFYTRNPEGPQGADHWNLNAVTYCEKTQGQQSSLDYCWPGEEEADRNDFHRYNAVQGDDDFVVIFCETGYMVYCFLTPTELETRRRRLLGRPSSTPSS